jgi:hypothetical protein
MPPESAKMGQDSAITNPNNDEVAIAEKGPGSSTTKAKAELVRPDNDIDPKNEIQGSRLILIHTALCLCTFLVGLVSFLSHLELFVRGDDSIDSHRTSISLRSQSPLSRLSSTPSEMWDGTEPHSSLDCEYCKDVPALESSTWRHLE